MVTIAILIGSESDREIAQLSANVLDSAGVDYEIRIFSAHRNPVELEDYIQKSDAEVFIAIAGLSAALPGVIASRTKTCYRCTCKFKTRGNGCPFIHSPDAKRRACGVRGNR